MTISNTTDRPWSYYLRFLAPGPISLGMHSCVDPAVWHATWRAVGAGRDVVHAQAEDEDMAQGRKR